MPKVLAEEGDWLRSAVAALVDGGCDDVVVVLGAALVPAPAPARAVAVTDWESGVSASLRAGLAAVEGADVVVIRLVDTPDVTADVVRRVLDSNARLARATYEGRPGHPVVIAREFWTELLASSHGDEGARAFLAGRDDVVLVECGDLASGADIDER